MSLPEHSAKDIFAEALRLTNPAERAAYLDQACAGNPGHREEVESLLSAHERAGSFLRPTVVLPEPDVALEHAGTRIGRYKLLEQVGEGGFGVVWMAEQEEPVRRRVALKIIKLGMDTKEVVARFEAERQALALMDHPNIAGIFDGGATESGRPYFVMELVKGIPITKFCDERKLTTDERLELFLQVCHAVQHAHQKGVIHRDLKPSNILVTVRDDWPVPKVIDFGVAKATQARLTQKTLFTRLHQWIGTPAYMSPEQVGLGSLDVDTRSDIYSLGVLLYELLTGRTPFDTEKLLAVGYEAVMRTIREEEPPKPSTRISTLAEEELNAVAARRGAEPAKLGRLVRGDLDWIVMKCLEKDRTRRYETADGLALDLTRYLGSTPVIARPPSYWDRLQKLTRRHRLAFTAAAAVMLALCAGTVVSTVMFLRERASRKQALENEYTMLAAALKAEQLARALEQAMGGRENWLLRGETNVSGFHWGHPTPMTAYFRKPDALERAVAGWPRERIRKELVDRPELKADLLFYLGRHLIDGTHLANLYGATDEHTPAPFRERERLDVLRETLALREQIYQTTKLPVAEVLDELASVLVDMKKSEEAESNARAGLEIRRREAPDGLEVANSLEGLASVLSSQKRFNEEEQAVAEALRIMTRLLPPNAPALTMLWSRLSQAQENRGDLAGACQSLRECLARLETGPESYLRGHLPRVRLLSLLRKRGEAQEAETLSRAALALAETNEASQFMTNVLNLELALALQAQEKFAEAVSACRKAVGTETNRSPLAERCRLSLGSILADWAWSQFQAKPTTAAAKAEILEHAREAKSILRKQLGSPDKAQVDKNWYVSVARSRLGEAILILALSETSPSEESRKAALGEAEAMLTLSTTQLSAVTSAVEKRANRCALAALVRLCQTQKNAQKAAEWESKLKGLESSTEPGQRSATP
jgi:eukaryotic-like serine/threonine-protein kinase